MNSTSLEYLIVHYCLGGNAFFEISNMNRRKVTFSDLPTVPPSHISTKNALFPTPLILSRYRGSVIPRGGHAQSLPTIGEYVVESVEDPSVHFEEDMTPANIHLTLGQVLSVKGSKYRIVGKRFIVHGYVFAIERCSGRNTIISMDYLTYMNTRIHSYIVWNGGNYLVRDKRLSY